MSSAKTAHSFGSEPLALDFKWSSSANRQILVLSARMEDHLEAYPNQQARYFPWLQVEGLILSVQLDQLSISSRCSLNGTQGK